MNSTISISQSITYTGKDGSRVSTTPCVHHSTAYHAFTISINSGLYYIQVLPDLGVDISSAGQQILHHLNKHINIYTEIISCTANEDKMKFMVRLTLRHIQS